MTKLFFYQDGNKNLAKYSIAVQSLFEYELKKNKNDLLLKELIRIVNDLQKVLRNQVSTGNCKDLIEFLTFSRNILFQIKHKNLLIGNQIFFSKFLKKNKLRKRMASFSC